MDYLPKAEPITDLLGSVVGYQASCECGWKGEKFQTSETLIRLPEARTHALLSARMHADSEHS